MCCGVYLERYGKEEKIRGMVEYVNDIQTLGDAT